MLLEYKAKIITPFVGSGKLNSQATRPILYSRKQFPKLFKYKFLKLIEKYIHRDIDDSVNLEESNMVDVSDDIHLEKSDYPKVKEFTFLSKRSFNNPNGENIMKSEYYPEGTKFILKLSFDAKKITKEQLKTIISTIGEFDGISQYGSQFGYGRFEEQKE